MNTQAAQIQGNAALTTTDGSADTVRAATLITPKGDALPELTALEQARFGARGAEADHFLGFWLRLLLDLRMHASTQRRQQFLDDFLRAPALLTAIETEGDEAVNAALTDGARTYFTTCLNDPKYRTSWFGLKSLSENELHAKVAADAAGILEALAGLSLTGWGSALPRMLVDGALAAMPGCEANLRAAAVQFPGALRLLDEILPRS